MHRGEAFGDILAEKLRNVDVESPSPSRARAGFGPVPSPILLNGAPRVHFRATPYGRMAGSSQRQAGCAPCGPPCPPAAAVPPTAPSPRAPRRSLSPGHQRALDALIGFGVDLDADFTEAELRSAFRALARRYHPDRHPGSDASENRRLAGVFSGLADHYRALLAVTRAPLVVN
jgi:hypothetical protein